MDVHDAVTYTMPAGGTLTLQTADTVQHTGVNNAGAYWDDLHFDSASNLTFDLDESTVVASQKHIVGHVALEFVVPDAPADTLLDLTVTGLKPTGWYVAHFNGKPKQCADGETKARADDAGVLAFHDIEL